MAEGAQWRRGHYARGRGGYRQGPVTPLPPPGPEAPGDDDDDPGDPGIPEAVPEEWAAPPAGPPAGEPEPAEPAPVTPDPPAAKVPARGGRGGTPKRVTAAVRADVEGKFGLMLEMAGGVWSARDPVCGGAFRAQLPAIRPAAVELILLSPDLVAWFTGVGGGWMLWWNLLAACWPVGVVVWSHHVAHAGDDDEGQGAAPAAAYAA